MEIVRINNPFQRQDRDIEILNLEGSSIKDLVLYYILSVNKKYKTCLSLEYIQENVQVSINGSIIPSIFWDTTKPQQSDQIVFMPIVGKGSTEKTILSSIALIAAFIVLGPAGGVIKGVGLGLSGVGLFASMAAVSVGIGLINANNMPGVGGGSGKASSQAFAWEPATLQQQGITKPKFYGKNKLYGNIISASTGFTVEVGNEKEGPYKQNLNMLISLGSGPVQGIIEDSVKINDQNITNFPDISYEERLGTLDQTVTSFFSTTKIEYNPNILVTQADGPKTYTTPDADFDDLEIEILFPFGLFALNSDKTKKTKAVELKIEISEAGEDDWTTLFEDEVEGRITSPIRFKYVVSEYIPSDSEFSIENGKQYDIKVTRIEEDTPETKNYKTAFYLGAVREIINDSFTYPLTSLVALSAVASDRISGGLNFSCVQEGSIVNVYSNGQWNLEYSNNPAWILWDILTIPVISGDGSSSAPYMVERYDGIDYGSDPTRLDLLKFIELAEFCDDLVPDKEGSSVLEKRNTFNGGFDTDTTVWEAALIVAEIARTSLLWNGVELTLAIDKAADPVQMFTISNISKDSFKETFTPQSELASEIEIHYRDEDQDYERVPFSIIDESLTNASSRVRMDLFGITKQSEAWRAGMYRLAQNKYLKSSIEFQADIDAIACMIGDVILVQHDVPEWGTGGRIVSGTTFSFIADKDLEYESGITYEVQVRLSDDTLNERLVTSKYNPIIGVSIEDKEFYITGDYSNEYKNGDRVQVVDSGNSIGNDGIYTLDGNASYADGITTITVNEDILDDSVNESSIASDGGIYNLRRVVVSSVFLNASEEEDSPAAGDLYVFGLQNLNARKYRIVGMRKEADQYISINAVIYNPLLYDPDNDNPITVLQQSIQSPQSDGYVVNKPLSREEILAYSPIGVATDITADIPLTSNLTWNNDTPNGDSISWSATNGDYAIIVTYLGETYDITAGNSNKKYIYWDVASPLVFTGTDTASTAVGVGKWIMSYNDEGTAYPAFGAKIIHGGILQVGSVFAEAIDTTDLFVTNDVIIGNYAGGYGMFWDWSAGTFAVKGTMTIQNSASIALSGFNNNSGWTDDTAANNAQADANAAQNAANDAQDDANTALAALSDIASDSKITPVEKLTLLPLWNAILAEKTDLDTQANALGVSKTAYGTAYSNLYGYVVTSLNTFGSMAATTTITRSTWDAYFVAYYNAKIEILNAFTTAIKSTVDTKNQTFYQDAAPTAVKTGDIWLDTTNNKLKRWNGADWTTQDFALTASSIQTGILNATVTLTDDIILSTSGTIQTTGKTDYTDDTAGIFIGYDTNGGTAYKMYIGDVNKNLKWSGSSLIVTGDVVATSNINDNAITNIVTDSDTTGGTLTAVLTEVCSVEVAVATGQKVLIFISFQIGNEDANVVTVEFIVERGSTILHDCFDSVSNSTDHYRAVSANFIDSPSAGTYTYSLSLGDNFNDGNIIWDNAILIVVVVKK